MPVYNGGPALRTVIEGVLAQTYPAFRLVISDNASTDGTEGLCREIAERDPRVTYIRQSVNIGPEANFDFVLNRADTEYFMWAAADDLRSEDFLQQSAGFLDGHPDYVGATCPVRFSGRAFDPVGMGDETRDETDRFERMLRFFATWHANGRFYSLFRTDAVRRGRYSGQSFLGADWVTVLELLSQGKMMRLESGYVELGKGGASHTLNIFSRYRRGMAGWVFPFKDFSIRTARLFSGARPGQKLKLLGILAKLNVQAVKLQIRFEIRKRRRKVRAPVKLSGSTSL